MQIIKKLKLVISILAVIIIVAPNANSAEKCFERTSRAIFKFNMALDDIVLEPLAKGTINYHLQLELVQVTSHRILELYCLFLIIFCKEI